MERLGAFEVREELARGGFGVVYNAVHRNGTPAAVKLMKNLDAEAIQREIYAVARLDHPHIVSVFDQGTLGPGSTLGPEGSPYFIMERCSGGSLAKLPGRRDWDWLRTTLVQLLQALAHAHAHEVIHLDIKPANILFADATDARPGLKLADFGISLTRGKGAAAYGTPTYMAPEQHGDDAEIGPWTDLYALGIVAWMVVATPPFAKSGRKAMADKCTNKLLPFRPRFPVPEGFEAWLKRLLRGEWSQRYLTAADALHALHIIDQGAVGFAPAVALEDAPTEMIPATEITAKGPNHYTAAPSPKRVTIDFPKSEGHVPAALQETGLALLGLREPPFIGREEVCRQLWDAWVKGRETRTRILVTGMPGVGRHRCLQWLAQHAHTHGGASAASFRDLDPSMPARDLVRRALATTDTHEAIRSRLESLDLLDGPTSDAVDELYGPYNEQLAPIFAVRILGALARRMPVMLCLPNQDPESVWIRVSAELDEPITWVFTGPESLPDVTTIDVNPLDPEVMAATLREWLPFAPVAVESLVRAANGYPGVLTLLVRQAVATDALRPGPEGWELDSTFEFGTGFASRVTASERQVAGIAAWLGPWCTAARLTEVLGIHPKPVIERLVRTGIWRRTGKRLQYADPRHRSEAEAWVQAPDRLRKLATLLEKMGDHSRASRAWLEAGDILESLEQTVQGLMQPGHHHQMTRAHTVREAIKLAYGLPMQETLQGKLWIAEARCCWEAGDDDSWKRLQERYEEAKQRNWPEVEGVIAQYMRLMRPGGPGLQREIDAYERMPEGLARDARLGIALRDLALHTSDDEMALALYRQCLVHLDHDETRYGYLYALSEQQLRTGKVEESIATARAGIVHAREHQPYKLTNAWVHLCSVLLDAKRFGAAAEACGSAAARARLLGAAPALMVSLGNQALALGNLGRWEEASQSASQALQYTGYPVFGAVLRAINAIQAARTDGWSVVEEVIDEIEAIGTGFAALGWDATWTLGALATACEDRPDLEERVLGVLAAIKMNA